MTSATVYQKTNQAGLCRELDRVYRALTRLSGAQVPEENGAAQEAEALNRIAQVFGLTGFERDVLLLCAGVELESRFAPACAAVQNDPRLPEPTFGLALAALSDAHWSALSRSAPLRYWRLVEMGSGGLLRSPLRIDQRIAYYLAGIECEDERLEGVVHAVQRNSAPLSTSHCECARHAAEHWMNSTQRLVLVGRRHSERRCVTREICHLLGRKCYAMLSADVPSNAREREQLARFWNREALLTGAVLCVETPELETHELGRLSAFLNRIDTLVILEIREGSAAEQMEGLRIQIPALDTRDRKAIWIQSLGADALRVNGELDCVAEYFDLDGESIQMASKLLRGLPAESSVGRETWRTCRALSRRALDGLARRVEPKSNWQDLILPALQAETLTQIAAQVRQRAVVYGQWGFGDRYSRGLGVTALFAGSSGTGKTMAAEVIAHELDLDLYQIDLAGVVSKYIGETEKNLRRIFDAADESGAVLLFDEADALFGKRSEVRDSHDRYANLEISYLLQRMESYRGLAILTTNMKQVLDPAFLRRIRFLVQFPFPGEAERRRIWERVFPEQAPLGALNFARMAKLNIAGGLIRNIATHAAFLAADQGTEIGMSQILTAARVEYAKLERPLTHAEIGAWT
jgi:hypothetical protein